MVKNFDQKLKDNLKQNIEFWDEEIGDINRNEIIDRAYKVDKDLIGIIIKDKEFREIFFDKIEEYWVFNINKFVDYIENIKVLSNSYTKFKNIVGLNVNGKYLNESGEVSLVWPFKDCVLEGGMTKEDQKRNEIFFNEILAKDEIDRLFDAKVLTNFKKYTAKGEEKVKNFNRDEKGTIKDNLVLKGNNLLALHSLKKEFAGKVKLIYIDPPFNTDGDSFLYNDRFKHSTWLTFMKNRLEISRKLLTEDGKIFIHLDNNEIGYCKVLCDEIFKDNFLQLVSIRKATTAGFKAINFCPTTVTEYILIYAKDKQKFKNKILYKEATYNEDYGTVIDNKNENPELWKLISLNDVILKQTDFKSWKEAEKKWGPMWKDIRKSLKSSFASENKDMVVSIKDLHKPSQKIKEFMDKSKQIRNKVFVYPRKDIGDLYLINGRSIAFYSSKFKEIDGVLKPAEPLTNFWEDISWYGIANEGGVTLKNAKKPEKLLKRIIDLGTEKGEIVMDYHLGSGTTCAVAHKMGRQYIGIEQLDYNQNDSVVRLNNVIKGDSTGVSKSVSWKDGGEFIYCELMKYNEEAIGKIRSANDTKTLVKIWKEMQDKYFLNFDVEVNKFNDNKKYFEKMTLKQQKETLVEMLNKNQLYVNLSEIEDSQFKVSQEDKELNKKFYGVNEND